MALRAYKPTSPGRRFATTSDFKDLTAKKPNKALLEPLRKTGGRNNSGTITCWHHGGGNKKNYRVIDWKRNKAEIPAKVETIEYDPNRNVRIALLLYKDGERRYIIAPKDIRVGETLVSGERPDPKPGNCMPLRNVPLGHMVHCVELIPGHGAQIVRAAGCFAQLMAKEGNYAHLQFPSGEMRKVPLTCRATIGQLGNIEAASVWLGKAGRKRWLGIRPTNRGTSMNPVSHPMGGGEGRSGGGRHPCSPWGKLAKGGKTRKKRKTSSKFIIRGRKKGPFQQT
ncbi:MAG: 50S ribosomal protein L2 [Candidatus Brocadiae bacterium]|nr:50S ribosomal protein L2 [Candidatus Brocadiia bacterium]